jgi:hypothetical protein
MKRITRHIHNTLSLAGVVALGLVTCVTSPALAADQTGGVPGEWLSSYLGVRSAGMGGAFVATADSPTGVIWNPAGLSFMFQNEVHLETARLFESTSINGLSFAIPARHFPSVGMTVLNLRSGEFEQTNEFNEPLGEFTQSDMAFYFTAAKSLSHRFSVGTNVKVVRQTFGEFDGTGVGFDLGAMYKLTPALRIGASVLNIGGPSLTLREVDETYPVEVRGGAALQIFGGRGLVAVELNHQSGPGASFYGGTEFWVHRSMVLRVGYGNEAAMGGFGFNASPNLRLDYAATDHELGVTHRFGVSYRFGGFFASSQAVPPVFSPIGQQSVTKFHLKTRTKTEAQSWSLEIVDKSNQVVRRFSGKGSPPAHVMWDGKDEAGLPLPDGSYKYTLTVVDAEGRVLIAHERTVEITTEGPQGTVPVFTE